MARLKIENKDKNENKNNNKNININENRDIIENTDRVENNEPFIISRSVVKVEGEFIKLQDAIKLGGLCMTGGQAKLAIQNGEVLVNGEVCQMRGKKLRTGDRVLYDEREIEVIMV